jgi:[ribosomal protein S18]-alanine N-acetyltransferase
MFQLRRMSAEDVPAVLALDVAVKPSPWTLAGFLAELDNERSFPLVLMTDTDNRLVGYHVYWLVADELMVNTIVVDPVWRGQGWGELLLLAGLYHGRGLPHFPTFPPPTMPITTASLEVRASNHVAQKLYRKYEFQPVGRRARYYRDNGEDAVVMVATELDRPAYEAFLAERWGVLSCKL